MLKTIGLEQIQTQGLEGLVFDLLSKKIYNEPFFVSKTEVPKPRQPKAVSSPFSEDLPWLDSYHTAPRSITFIPTHLPFP